MKTLAKKEDMSLEIVENRVGLKIPENCKVVSIKPEYVKVKREDGLNVFLSEKDDRVINEIRLYETDRRKVIMAIGIYRGMQIAENYRERYADELSAVNVGKLIEGDYNKYR